MFGKTRIEKLACSLVGNLAVHAPTEFGMLLDPGDGRPDRSLMRGDDPFIARHQCHDRHRLRRFDGKVPPRMMLNFAIPDTPDLLTIDLAGEPRPERLPVDRPPKTQVGRTLPAPPRGRPEER